jgi:hypothetical protein
VDQEEAVMDAALKSKWVKALLSGDYKQGRGLLHDDADNTNCCLGVLCEVVAKEDPRIQRTQGGYSFNKKVSVKTDLSNVMRRHFGLTWEDEGDLIEMNDVKGNSFFDIAVYIEQNL